MEKDEIRRKILEALYSEDEKRPGSYVDRALIKERLDNIENNLLDSSISYLEGKGYILLLKSLGSHFTHANITTDGKDIVENRGLLNKTFPINILQNIITNSTGVIIGDNNSLIIEIENNFKTIYQEIEKRNTSDKQRIIEEVRTIEDELKKENINRNILKKSIHFVKQNASWVLPILTEIIKKSFM